jgi:PBSX family phage portal protein
MVKTKENLADPKPSTAFVLPRKTRTLFPKLPRQGKMSVMEFLSKAAPDPEKVSKQKAGVGRKMHPFDRSATTSFKNFNSHHSACIETKKNSIIGLGFKKDTTEKKLNPLCDISFQDVGGDMVEDFVQTGDGYIEVVRKGDNPNSEIIGLHHVPAAVTWVNIENRKYQRHYEVIHQDTDASALYAGAHKFAAFGDLEGFLRRHTKAKREETSEIIHFRNPSSLSRWYGMPNWLAAVAAIELKQCLYQYNYDFFLNRGVPEFLLFLLGGDVGQENMDALKQLLMSHIGLGNSHKSGVFNIPQEGISVILERLGLDSTSGEDGFTKKSETMALDIVTAHQVPPLLAGIQIPGKLGANNEMINAMMAFQTLVVAPMQKTIMTILNNTLGNSLYNAGIDLGSDAFKLKTIMDEIDLQKADTAGRMREEVTGSKRDLSAGTKN